MKSSVKKISFLAVLVTLLGLSFWFSPGWLQLCAGLAIFLFGMQCLEEGLKQLAGSKLNTWLERGTATRGKSFLFGMGGTMLLQSTTLMSLLTIAFISTGLIQLAGGISILLGINLGTSAGIWLLAAAGQGFSLSPLALPLLVFGVLAGFHGDKGRATGRLVLGIAFIFLGIDQLKLGFSEFGAAIDFTQAVDNNLIGQLILVAIGLVLTAILQSSHATLMLILAALATGQIELWQGMALAIGGNVGSSVTTAIVGWLGGNRGGQRLAVVHVLFNLSVAIITLLLLTPLAWLCQWLMSLFTSSDNPLLQLALFQTLFNLIGVLLFWPWQNLLEQLLLRLLPDPKPTEVLIEDRQLSAHDVPITQARYLTPAALTSFEAASHALVQELQFLGRLSLEVICHALYQPVEQLLAKQVDEARLMARPEQEWLDAQILYERHVKGVYGDLLDFISRLDIPQDSEQQEFWRAVQSIALQLVDAVKDAKHLQKNLGRFLQDGTPYMQDNYFELRRHLICVLRQVHEMGQLNLPDEVGRSRLEWFDSEAAHFDNRFRQRIFNQVRESQLNGRAASSLMNDLGYASRISQSLRNVMQIGLSQEGDLLRAVRRLSDNDDLPLISV